MSGPIIAVSPAENEVKSNAEPYTKAKLTVKKQKMVPQGLEP